MSDTQIHHHAPSRLRQSAALAVSSVGIVLAALLMSWPVLPAGTAIAGMLLYGAIAVSVLEHLESHLPFDRFGAANWITLARGGGTALLAGLLVSPALLAEPRVAWSAMGVAGLLLALDGVDGWAARRQRLCSRFGARFDMEVDALLILVLSAFALALGKAGPWVLALGLMRYGFVAAGMVLPALRQDLYPSLRRKAVCVLQIAVLTALLAPPLAPPVTEMLAAAALAALAWSFAIDVRWLLRRRPA